MNFYKKIVALKTQSQVELIDITEEVKDTVEASGIKNGQVNIFSPHTTASIIINHNEALLIQDITHMLYRLAPIDERYGHDMFELTKAQKSDGRSNGHSHCKNVVLGVSQTLIVENGEILLGSKQNIFFAELDGARQRDYIIHIIGE